MSDSYFRTEKRIEKIKWVVSKRQPSVKVVIENIHDPHNVSAIFRTCDAAGIPKVSLLYSVEKFPKIGKKSSASAYKWIEREKFKSGRNSFGELIEMLGNGLYILDAKGGQTSGENFTFGAQYGYIVKDGTVREMIRDINISGNLYHTLKNITAAGDDLVLSKTGGCGKGQLNIRSCHGAPHLLVRDVVVGGK